MNIIHVLWTLFLAIFFVLAFFIRKGVLWGIVLALSIFLAYKGITNYWDAIMFPPIIGIFIISIMGFIHDSFNGRLI